MTYRLRVLDTVLRDRLESSGAVLIEGPKASGKTSTARRQARSEVLLDVDRNARQQLQLAPELVLGGEPPQLVDEWELEANVVWNHVRRLVDERGARGQFILTGSSVPEDEAARHSGAGRIATIQMRPMSLFESGGLNAEVSLASLLGGESPNARVPKVQLPDLLETIAKGGWPSHVGVGLGQALQANRDYLDQIRQVDVNRVTGNRRDPFKLHRLMQSLARNVSTDVSIKTLMADTRTDDGEISRPTVDGYLDTLERLRIIENQPAWSTHLRSAATLRLTPKRHFVDPSLAVAALRATPTTLLADLDYTGFLFESMAVRDLRVLSQPLDGTVFHYRDSNGLEVDAIIELPDGRWGAFEVKLGTNQAEDAAVNLLRFRSTIDTTKRGAPGVLAVITGDGEYAVTRPDGVTLVPIGALRP